MYNIKQYGEIDRLSTSFADAATIDSTETINSFC